MVLVFFRPKLVILECIWIAGARLSGSWNQKGDATECFSNKKNRRLFQDPDASFDFNDFDGDPRPRDENLENW